MRVWTAHTREGRQPVLVPEGFSFWALVLGPIWLLAHRAWIATILVIAASIAITAVPWTPIQTALSVAIWLLVGLSAHDLRRWSLSRRGFTLAHVVVARDRDGALLRLLDQHPDLAVAMSPPVRR
jgi:hypothetical protein